MKTINLLLGNSEGLLNNFIEALVQDACQAHAIINATHTRTVEQFTSQGLRGSFDLAIVIPNNLASETGPGRGLDIFEEASHAIRLISQRTSTPVIAIGVFDLLDRQEKLLFNAGSACVLELPLQMEALILAVKSLPGLMDQPEQPASSDRILSRALDGVRGRTPVFQAGKPG